MSSCKQRRQTPVVQSLLTPQKSLLAEQHRTTKEESLLSSWDAVYKQYRVNTFLELSIETNELTFLFH